MSAWIRNASAWELFHLAPVFSLSWKNSGLISFSGKPPPPQPQPQHSSQHGSAGRAGNRPIGSIGASSSGDGAIFTSTRRLWKGRRMRREEGRGEPHATHAPLSADPIWKAPQKADEPSRRRRFVPLLPPTFKLRTNEFHADVRGRRPLRQPDRRQRQNLIDLSARSDPDQRGHRGVRRAVSSLLLPNAAAERGSAARMQ